MDAIAPTLVHIEYLYAEEGEPKREHAVYIPLEHLACGLVNAKECDQRHFRVEVRIEGTRLTVSIVPLAPIEVSICRVLFTGEFAQYERALFNGYQSWTDTKEVALTAAQRGLVGTPKSIVNRFVLDGSGDYRFKRYSNRPGSLHGWSYAYFIGPSGVWMVAGVDETRGFTLLDWTLGEGLNAMPGQPARELAIGERTVLADLAVIFVPRGDEGHADEQIVDAAFDQWFDQMRDARPDILLPRSDAMLTGYSSWYRHYGNIDHEKIISDLAVVSRTFELLDTTGFTRVFQIDDGYCKVGDWERVDTTKFPMGLAPLSSEIRARGFMPGLWMAPFVCEKNSLLHQEHPDWLLRDASGQAVKAGSHWSGSYALDTRNVDVRAYVTSCLQMATREWGFRLLKLDFLYAACMIPHDGMNRGQLMADAMSLVREAVGPDVLIDGCGVPLASAFGVVDFCRIGCDVGLDWDGAVYMRLTERERVSTKNSLTNTVYRAPLDGRAFGNDPDVVLLRPDVSYTEEQRAMILTGDACHASMLLTSDDTASWTLAQIDDFQQALNLMSTAHAQRAHQAKSVI